MQNSPAPRPRTRSSRFACALPAATLVQSLFDLTAAELAIASDIAAGLTVAQIAQKSQRSVNTVRNQLSSILHKTGAAGKASS